MSEFEKELEKNMKLRKVAYERESIDSDFFVSKWDIERIFKDWQPPKPLVVVPQFVADYIKTQKDNDYDGNAFLISKHYEYFEQDGNVSKLDMWIACNFNDFLKAIVNGYTVEKEKKYILKHIDLSEQYNYNFLYLSHGRNIELGHERIAKGIDMSKIKQCHFTQSEIDKLNVGSYEQIEVKVEE